MCYIDNQTLWQHMMHSTASSLPEVIHRCREVIHNEEINSIVLIESCYNLSNSMTKLKANNSLAFAIKTNYARKPVKRVFMLQTILYRHFEFIPASSVPMSDDMINNKQTNP